MISDIRAKHGTDSVDLQSCGKFTLAEDLSDIEDITSIDLSDIDSLEGDIKALEKCTQLTSVDFEECQVTGESSGGRFLSELRSSALFLEEFFFLRILRELSRVARKTCRNFKENS